MKGFLVLSAVVVVMVWLAGSFIDSVATKAEGKAKTCTALTIGSPECQ